MRNVLVKSVWQHLAESESITDFKGNLCLKRAHSQCKRKARGHGWSDCLAQELCRTRKSASISEINKYVQRSIQGSRFFYHGGEMINLKMRNTIVFQSWFVIICTYAPAQWARPTNHAGFPVARRHMFIWTNLCIIWTSTGINLP